MPFRPKPRVAAMRGFTVLSLVLAALLVVSCFVSFSYDRSGTLTLAADGPNGSTIIHRTYWIPIIAVNAGCLHMWRRDYLDIQSSWHLSGSRTAPTFAWKFTQSSDPMRKERSLTIPLWRPLLLTAAPVPFLRQTARARRRADLCPACAYDLKGLPPDSPCPECGSK